MIQHLFKMIWNRKRANAMMMTEIFGSFIVLFGVCLFGLHYYTNFNAPLGFDYQNVWSVSLTYPQRYESGNEKIDHSAELKELINSAEQLHQVESAARVTGGPYTIAYMSASVTTNSKPVTFSFSEVSDSFDRVMNIKVQEGTWFQTDDRDQPYHSIVINSILRQELFGDEPAVGKYIDDDREYRIRGVVDSFRAYGELSTDKPFTIILSVLEPGKVSMRPDSLFLKMRPDTPIEFEQILTEQFQRVAPEFSFQIESLEKIRRNNLRIGMAPLLIASLIAGFLLIMVALGLTGVLWQNVIHRTKEFGLRRAQGATRSQIFCQVSGELSVLTIFSIGLGSLLVIQFPILNLIPMISDSVYFSSILLSGLVIYGITLLSGVYPSWLATRLHPSDALHYE